MVQVQLEELPTHPSSALTPVSTFGSNRRSRIGISGLRLHFMWYFFSPLSLEHKGMSSLFKIKNTLAPVLDAAAFSLLHTIWEKKKSISTGTPCLACYGLTDYKV